MALYNNGYRLGNSPFKRGLGALTTIYNGMGSSFNHSMPTSAMRASYWLYGKYSAYPKGGGHPDCWMLPQVGGAMSCKTACAGGGSLTVSMAAGIGIEGTAAGVCTLSGELTGLAWVEGSAPGGSSVSATLSGYGFIAGLSAGSAQADGSIFAAVAIQGTASGSSDATGTGYLALSMAGTAAGSSTIEGSLAALLSVAGTASGSSSASATITGGYFAEGVAVGSSTATGALPIGYGWVSCTLSGAGSLNADPSAIGFMEGSTDVTTELTTDGIATAVWRSIASQFNDTGTMGNKLNTASSGGVDLGALSDAVWGASEAEHLAGIAEFMQKVLVNKREVKKVGDTWTLFVYDDNETTPILTKALKDVSGGNIADLAAGILAAEEASSV